MKCKVEKYNEQLRKGITKVRHSRLVWRVILSETKDPSDIYFLCFPHCSFLHCSLFTTFRHSRAVYPDYIGDTIIHLFIINICFSHIIS